MTFALLGGDDRCARLARLLRADGHTVRAFALEKKLPDCAGSAEEALIGADCVILPLPCERDGALNAPFCGRTYTPAELLYFAAPGTLVCAGRPRGHPLRLPEAGPRPRRLRSAGGLRPAQRRPDGGGRALAAAGKPEGAARKPRPDRRLRPHRARACGKAERPRRACHRRGPLRRGPDPGGAERLRERRPRIRPRRRF